ncbi:hypothetical protein KR018_007234 [Drosophila ironensis]|nr:hypothetical protein KR018_007234 [Drosophila ironensis]
MLLPKTYEANFESIIVTGKDHFDFSNIRLIGREHNANGTFVILQDLDNEHYFLSGEAFNDIEGNGEFKKLPFEISKLPICTCLNFNWAYAKGALQNGVTTNFPTDPLPCPIPKGTYYIRDMPVNTDNWPAVMPRGFMKGVATIYKMGDVIGTFEIVIQIKNRN